MRVFEGLKWEEDKIIRTKRISLIFILLPFLELLRKGEVLGVRIAAGRLKDLNLVSNLGGAGSLKCSKVQSVFKSVASQSRLPGCESLCQDSVSVLVQGVT